MTRTPQGLRMAGSKGKEFFDFASHKSCKYIEIEINGKCNETMVRRDDPDGVRDIGESIRSIYSFDRYRMSLLR